MPEPGNRALQPEQQLAVMIIRCGMRPQPGERNGVQVLQPGASVDEQRLAEPATQAVLVVQRAAVTPAVQGLRRCAHRRLDRGVAEDELRQVQPVEGPQQVEVVEAAEQVADRDQERPHRGLGRCHPGGQERLRARSAQPRPVGRRPRPVDAAGLDAVLQHQPSRVRAGASVTGIGLVVQQGPRVIQWPGQAGQLCPQRSMLGGAPSAAAP
jgi:hypothetical protein